MRHTRSTRLGAGVNIERLRQWWRRQRPVVIPWCAWCDMRRATGRYDTRPICSDCHCLAIRHGVHAVFADHPQPGTLTVRNGHPVAGGRRLP